MIGRTVLFALVFAIGLTTLGGPLAVVEDASASCQLTINGHCVNVSCAVTGAYEEVRENDPTGTLPPAHCFE